jgi:hypothetical protein
LQAAVNLGALATGTHFIHTLELVETVLHKNYRVTIKEMDTFNVM